MGGRRAARALARLAMAMTAGGALANCAPQERGGGVIEPENRAPTLRIGLATGAASMEVGGGSAIAVTEPDGALIGFVTEGTTWTAAPGGRGVTLRDGAVTVGGTSFDVVQLTPSDTAGFVRINGRDYRGDVVVFRDRSGITAVNRVDLESYLGGVVLAEMGRRERTELEALKAQAIISRTYALRNLARWNADGFDLMASVMDQVYGGVASEGPLGWEAVNGTRGTVVAYRGDLARTYYYSTCGGRTSDGAEVFADADQPYLVSIRDVDAAGQAYCVISPRFRWHEEWTGDGLQATLRKNLPVETATPASRVTPVRSIRVVSRTPSDRVGSIEIAFKGSTVPVTGQAIRRVLRPSNGEILRSTAFTLTPTVTRKQVTRLAADGRGNGHGVGLCQWGAVGRARAGKTSAEIIQAYYPGTTLERRY